MMEWCELGSSELEDTFVSQACLWLLTVPDVISAACPPMPAFAVSVPLSLSLSLVPPASGLRPPEVYLKLPAQTCSASQLAASRWRRLDRTRRRLARRRGGHSEEDAELTWRLLCSSFLASILFPPMKRQVITKKEVHRSLQVDSWIRLQNLENRFWSGASHLGLF